MSRPYGFDVWEFSNAAQYKRRQGVVSIIHVDTWEEAERTADMIRVRRGHYSQIRNG
jgi:hypothetical protein